MLGRDAKLIELLMDALIINLIKVSDIKVPNSSCDTFINDHMCFNFISLCIDTIKSTIVITSHDSYVFDMILHNFTDTDE